MPLPFRREYADMARAIAITSGKGGVGKTNAATNIGVALSRLGRKVCIFDADLGLANVNILTGQTPTRTLENLFDGDSTIDDIIMDGPAGLHVVPSGSGVDRLIGLAAEKAGIIKTALEKLEKDHDYLIIDTAAGIGPDVLSFVKASHEAIVVVSPEPTSMTDAYALVKLLYRQGYEKNLSVLVNMTAGPEEGDRIFASFNNAAKKFLGRELKLAGHVVRDYALASSVLKQTPVSILYPESAASKCFEKIAFSIDTGFGPNGVGGFSGAWTDLIALGTGNAARLKEAPAAIPEENGSGQPDLEKIRKWLESPVAGETEAREAMLSLESSFVKRFGKPYFDFRTGLFSLLDFSEVTPGSLKEAALLLESIHERRFGKPLLDVEDLMLKALAGMDSPAKVAGLIDLFESSYVRRFGKRPSGALETVKRALAEGELKPEDMAGIVGALDAAHREEHGRPLAIEGRVCTEEMLPLLTRIENNEEGLSRTEESLKAAKAESQALKEALRKLVGDPVFWPVKD